MYVLVEVLVYVGKMDDSDIVVVVIIFIRVKYNQSL